MLTISSVKIIDFQKTIVQILADLLLLGFFFFFSEAHHLIFQLLCQVYFSFRILFLVYPTDISNVPTNSSTFIQHTEKPSNSPSIMSKVIQR